MDSRSVEIGIFSDIICPWCYIGKRKLEQALSHPDITLEVKIRHIPFQLFPHIPQGGILKKTWRKSAISGYSDHLKAEARNAGININGQKIKRIPNTMNAHRLLSLINDIQLQSTVSNELFRRYFEEGGDIESSEELSQIALSNGVNSKITDIFIQDPEWGRKEVLFDLQRSKRLGITAVPTFALQQELLISGVLESEKWIKYLKR